MSEQPHPLPRTPRSRRWPALLIGLLTVGFGLELELTGHGEAPSRKVSPSAPVVEEASSEQVHHFCGACHAYPPANTFPRSAWRSEVKRGYDFFRKSARQLEAPSLEAVVRYYEKRAPEKLPAPSADTFAGPPPVRWEKTGSSTPEPGSLPAISNVNLVSLFDKDRLDVLVCQTNPGRVWALQPYSDPPRWRLLGKVLCPARAEVVDLDGDGIKDVLVADLGNLYATEDRVGQVVWLKGTEKGDFEPITLLEGVGRVDDVQAADFDGDGKLDLVVAVFGWNFNGGILLLKNQTTDWSKPKFVSQILDDRTGPIHLCVGDVNGDGHKDFVALISQEHETVVAFLGDGKGHFRKETLYEAPHPAYGSSGIQLVDLDGDGDLDVLYTNGDTLDPPFLFKPYHGVQWLENQGRFPFVHHPLTALCGAMRAVAADLDGDGDLDVVAVSYLPHSLFPMREKEGMDAVILLEQTERGKFRRHRLESVTCDHLTCALGDLSGRGRVDLVVGNFCPKPPGSSTDSISIWRNVGKK